MRIPLSIVSALVLSACPSDEDLYFVQASGDFLTYTTSHADIEACEGNVIYAERWMRGVATELGIDPDSLLPTNYHLVDADDIPNHCPEFTGACAQFAGDHVEIYASTTLDRHELVHAVQFAGWPNHPRAVMREGLAVVYDDSEQAPLHWQPISSEHLDELLEVSGYSSESYIVGPYIVHWTIARHGIGAFESFWRADVASGSASATDFRALFEQHFGESLDAMIADVQKFGPACVIPTCVDDLVEWQGDRWTFDSPQTCTGTVRGQIKGDEVRLEHSVLIEIPAAGPYQVSVSEGVPVQGINIAPCSSWCGSDDWLSVHAGDVREFELQPGRYRIQAFKLDAEDPGVTIEIQAAG